MATPTAQILRRKSKIIMERWEVRARKEVSSSFGTTSLSLQDALLGHLDQLALALDQSVDTLPKDIAIHTRHEWGVGKEHGRDRANTAGYSIAEVIFEYRIFRQVIIQVLEEENPLSSLEREIITDLIEQAVNDAAVEFSNTLRDLSQQYTDTLTHDLRGPITAAKINANLIMTGAQNSAACIKNASRINDTMTRLDGMIQDLLDAGRVRAGESLSVNLAECDPSTIATQVIDELKLVNGERFVLKVDPTLRTWWAHDLMRRALENLLSNAVKYGAIDSAITVDIKLVNEGALVEISVHNDGSVIPKDEQSTLFKTYRRSKSAENSTKKGWGLGLTLVSGVVQAHRGKIRVESDKISGTTFAMTIPTDCRPDHPTSL